MYVDVASGDDNNPGTEDAPTKILPLKPLLPSSKLTAGAPAEADAEYSSTSTTIGRSGHRWAAPSTNV